VLKIRSVGTIFVGSRELIALPMATVDWLGFLATVFVRIDLELFGADRQLFKQLFNQLFARLFICWHFKAPGRTILGAPRKPVRE
jgi:hypothetical protein